MELRFNIVGKHFRKNPEWAIRLADFAVVEIVDEDTGNISMVISSPSSLFPQQPHDIDLVKARDGQ